jgi:hypothetical protein
MALKGVTSNQRLLIKLHGDFEDGQDRVLTLGEYTKAYGSSDANMVDLSQPLPRLFRLILHNRPLLFLGCSLNGDRTLRVLRQVAQDDPELIHYAIVELPAAGAYVPERDKFLSDHCIRPIWYPNGQHQSVALILRSYLD